VPVAAVRHACLTRFHELIFGLQRRPVPEENLVVNRRLLGEKVTC
jgi:hypothetical protein